MGVAIVAVVVVAACDRHTRRDAPDVAPVGVAGPGIVGPAVGRPAAPGRAAAALAALPVKGRAPKTGYARAQFGPAWADTDHDGCDQRNQVLGRDLTAVTSSGAGCVVVTGVLRDPYTGATVPFIRGALTQRRRADRPRRRAVERLADRRAGARRRPREMIATDPLNLLAVDGPTNQSKGDGDAATWLPPAKGYRCAYVARQVAVKTRYKLWVTPAERDAIARVLTDCPAQALP